MDAWESDFREPTEDERSARRVLALAIAFINARQPLSVVVLHREFYPDMNETAFRRAFQRDRSRLLTAGVALKRGANDGDFSTWVIDGESSFVKENLLSEQDALLLDALLLPLATDPSYPYARDLRLALTKIDHAFDGTSPAAVPPKARIRNNNVSRLEDCLSARHLARVSYTRADGSDVERTLAPYGFFFLNGITYMVAAQVMDDGSTEAPHTYNLDRVSNVRERARTSFELPPDFDIRDFVMLPFQLGPTLYQAKFQTKEGTVRKEDVASEDMAASWAIAEGVRPLEPPPLVAAWRAMLETAAKGGHDA